jgi:hypothetical protein
MGQIERLIQNYDTRVSLPWERNLAGPQRVWFAVYSKAEERRLRRRLEEFEISTKRAQHGWIAIDLTDAFACWLSQHEYRDGYFETPEHLEGESPAVDDFRDTVVRQVTEVLNSAKADENTVVALHGVASLFTAKKPDKTATIRQVISAHEGEITRHLVGTKVESRAEDDAAYVADYPLLPVRRRFWEKVLRAVDVAGTAAQLRNQLGIVYESVRAYADRPVETVVGGDSIYWVKATDLLQTGILQPKIDEMIRVLDDGSADGRLSARIGHDPQRRRAGGVVGTGTEADT